jgi:hypothetical protein
MSISIEQSHAACEKLWCQASFVDPFFHDWALRATLAGLCSMEPFFLVNEHTGTILPAGNLAGKLYFFGGLRYNERNGFFGRPGGEREIFDYLEREKLRFRFLSWQDDPLPYLSFSSRSWDVPYNQYWMLSGFQSFKQYLAHFPEGRRKQYQYFDRKFLADAKLYTDGRFSEIEGRIEAFFDHTIESFRKRNKSCMYEDAQFRKSVSAVLAHFHQKGMLRLIGLTYKSEEVGWAVFAEDSRSSQAVYLLNLYKESPANVSIAALLSIIQYCTDRGLLLDGMRGAFALKPRLGFRPAPSYALVKDDTWRVRAPDDLSQSELLALYKRDFGALGVE